MKLIDIKTMAKWLCQKSRSSTTRKYRESRRRQWRWSAMVVQSSSSGGLMSALRRRQLALDCTSFPSRPTGRWTTSSRRYRPYDTTTKARTSDDAIFINEMRCVLIGTNPTLRSRQSRNSNTLIAFVRDRMVNSMTINQIEQILHSTPDVADGAR